VRRFAILALVLVLAGCEDWAGHKEPAARSLVEACLREANIQGEQAGRLGVACAALNTWVNQQGWAGQPANR
jgi:hypothetical protein